MRKILKNTLVTMLVAGLCLSVVGMASADPTFDEITVSPEEPTVLSDVDFSVNITGDNIQEVRIEVEECVGSDFCYERQNVSMELEDGLWKATVTLEYDDVTVGHCWLVIKDNGTWYNYASNQLDQVTDFDILPVEDDDNGGDTTDDTGGTPGFELILVMISLVVALFIYKRKRM